MLVKFIPTKKLYSNPVNGFKVYSCRPVLEYEQKVNEVYPGLCLNKYKNFTVSGEDFSLIINEEYELEIIEDKKSKYPASYKVKNIINIDFGKNYQMTPEVHYSFLCQFMETSIAKSIVKSCPDFAQKILEGKENQIDYDKIKGVGPVRFNLYVEKVQKYRDYLDYIPICEKWGINNQTYLKEIVRKYKSAEDFNSELNTNPYNVFFNEFEMSFFKTDKLVLSHKPNFLHSKERAETGLLEILRENELEGDTRISNEIVVEMAGEYVPECRDLLPEVARKSDKIYYDEITGDMSNKSTYEAEVNIAKNLLDRVKNPETLNMDWTKFTKVNGFECTKEQAKILQLANEQKVCMLRGYGGSGKSSAMKALILMLEHYNVDYQQLAPTGIASKRLRETTGRDASTIHKFLGGFKESKLFNTVVLIDESSMVGVKLLSSLLDVLDSSCRIVFICDEAQLASISCGNVVQDIIDSKIIPTATLTKVFRYGSSGLATIATDTRKGVIDSRINSSFDDYKFYPVSSNPIDQIVKLYKELLDNGYSKDEILVLCPFNKGEYGTYVINNALQEHFNKHKETNASYDIKDQATITFKIGDKVLNTKNNYDIPVYQQDANGESFLSNETMFVANGDIGYVRNVHDTDAGVALEVEFDDGIACIQKQDIKNLLLGYAESIHKSQGQESKAVILFTSNAHKRLLTRNLLYVGDSRAKERLIEIGNLEAIEAGLDVEESKERDTWLKEMLLNGQDD